MLPTPLRSRAVESLGLTHLKTFRNVPILMISESGGSAESIIKKLAGIISNAMPKGRHIRMCNELVMAPLTPGAD